MFIILLSLNEYFASVSTLSFMWHVLQDSIKIDEDLLANSARSLETLVTVGMQLGVSFPKLENCSLES